MAARGRAVRVLSLPGRRFPYNPYLRLFCESFDGTAVGIVDLRSWQALLFRFDIVHVHFPEHYVSAQTLPRACFWVSVYACFFLLAKLLGKRIVWTVHNVQPFQNRHPWLLGPWMRLFRSLVDAHVFLSGSSRSTFAATFPRLAERPACVVPHGAYRVPPPDAARRSAWRARLAPPDADVVVGFLGGIKPYKNVGALLALPGRLSDGRRVHIVVAGKPDADSRPDLAQVAEALGGRVTILPDHTDDADLNHLIAAMDLVFLPYRKGWNSGFAMLVLGNRTKLLTSDLPMFRELEEAVGAPWILVYRDPRDLVSALNGAASSPMDEAAERRLDGFLARNSFEAGASRLAAFYATCLAR